MVSMKFLSFAWVSVVAAMEDCNDTPAPTTPCPDTPEPATPCPIIRRCAEIPEGEFFICTAQLSFGGQPRQKCLGYKEDIVIPADSDDCNNNEDTIIPKPKVYAVPIDLKTCDQNAPKFTVTKVEDKECTYTLACPECASVVHESDVVFGPKGLEYRQTPVQELAELYVKPAITINNPRAAVNFQTYWGDYIHQKLFGGSLIYKGTKIASQDLRLYATWDDVRYNRPQNYTIVEWEHPALWN